MSETEVRLVVSEGDGVDDELDSGGGRTSRTRTEARARPRPTLEEDVASDDELLLSVVDRCILAAQRAHLCLP